MGCGAGVQRLPFGVCPLMPGATVFFHVDPPGLSVRRHLS